MGRRFVASWFLFLGAGIRRQIGLLIWGWIILSGGLAPASSWGAFFESFEQAEFPPPGWIKTNLLGGSGWYRLPSGTMPMPGWGNGTSSVPPTAGGGFANAYCSWTTGGGATDGYHSDQWLISPKLSGLTDTTTLSYWCKFAFTNFPDSLSVLVSTNGPSPSQFTFLVESNYFAKGSWTNNFPPWSNHVASLGGLGIPAGTPIYIAFREYTWDNTWEESALELDVISSSDLTPTPFLRTSPPTPTFTVERYSDPAPTNFTVLNIGSGNLTYTNTITYSPGASGWLSLSAYSGTLAVGTSQTIAANAAASSLGLGTYYATNNFYLTGAITNPTKFVVVLLVNKWGQAITFPAIPTQTATNVVPLSATASSDLLVTFGIVSGPGKISGADLSFTNAGTVSVMAMQPGDGLWDSAPFVTNTFTVVKAPASVNLSPLYQPYDGTARAVTATTTPSGLPVAITYDGSATVPVNIGSYSVVGTINSALYTGSASSTLTVTQGLASVSLQNLSQVYDGTARPVSATTAPSGLTVDLTYGGLAAAPTNPGSYEVVGVVNSANYTGRVTNTLVVSKAPGSVAFTNLNQVYDGTARLAGVLTTPSGLTVDLTYDGSVNAPTNPGNYQVVGTIREAFYSGTATNTLTVAKIDASVSLSQLSQVYNGTARTAAAATVPSGLPVVITYNGVASAPVNAGSYQVIGTINDAHYSGAVTNTLTVSKVPATLALGQLSQVYDGTARTATAATVPSGLPVSFTYDGSSTAPTNSGSYTVAGTVDSPNYSGSATNTLVVSKATPAITFAGLRQVYNGAARMVTATTAPGGLTVVVTYDGALNAPTNPGSYRIVGTVNDLNCQGSATNTLVVSKIDASVFFANRNQVYDGTSRSVMVSTHPSGLPVVVTYDGAASAPTNAGVYPIFAEVNDPYYWGAASGTLLVAKAAATAVLDNLNQVYDGTARAVAATTIPASLPVAITYDGSTNAPTNAGSYEVVAVVNGQNYSGNTTNTLVVAKAAATATFSDLNQVYDGAAHPVATATVPSGLPVTFTYDGLASPPTNAGSYQVVGTINHSNYAGTFTNTLAVAKAEATVFLSQLHQVCDGTARRITTTTWPEGLLVEVTYDGSATAPTNAGSYQVVATVNDGNCFGAAAGTLLIGKAMPSVILGNLSQVYDGAAHPVSAASIPDGLMVNLTYNGSASAPTNAGSYEVVGTVDEANYATAVTNILVIAKAAASLTLANLSQVYDGTSRVATASTIPDGLRVEITYEGSASPPTNAGTYKIVGSIQDTNYAATVTNTLVVAKASTTVTLANLNQVYDGMAHPAAATTIPPGLPVIITYDGLASAPINAGRYTVAAVIDDHNYFGAATNTLTVAKTAAQIVFDHLSQVYSGAARPVSATTVPAGLALDFTYNGSANPPTNAGAYEVVGNIRDNNYAAAATNLLVVAKAAAMIEISQLSPVYTGGARPVSVTTVPAGLVAGVTYDNSPHAPTNAGVYQVVGTVNEDNYEGAATNTLQIAKAAATVYLTNLSQVYDGAPRLVAATSMPGGLPVSVTYDGSLSAPIDAGHYVVVGTVNDANYEGTGTSTLQVAKAPAAVSLANLSQVYDGTARPALAATAPNGLAVALTYDGAASAPTNTGQYTVVGVVEDINYDGAVTNTLRVAKAAATITLSNLSQNYDGTARQAIATTIPSGLTVALAYAGSPVAPTNAGRYQVAGMVNDPNYTGAVTQMLAVAKSPLIITPHNCSRLLGQPNPVLTGTVLGNVLADQITVAYATTATEASPAGVYSILPVIDDPLGRLGNYQLTLNAGLLTVGAVQPRLVLSGDTVNYTLGDSPVVLDALATFSGGVSESYGGATLMVEILSNLEPHDHLSLLKTGTAAGQIGVLGNTVTYGGTPIATLTGGNVGQAFIQFAFNSQADAQGIQQLIRNVAFAAAASESPQPERVLVMMYLDGATMEITSASLAVHVNHAPRADIDRVATGVNLPTLIAPGRLLANDYDPDGDALRIVGTAAQSVRGGGLVFDATQITYTPPLDFKGLDRFAYTISDGHGGSAEAAVAIQVLAEGEMAVVDLPHEAAAINQALSLAFQGMPERTYRLFATEDFLTWADLGAVNSTLNGFIRFTDSQATNHVHRFYQIRLSP